MSANLGPSTKDTPQITYTPSSRYPLRSPGLYSRSATEPTNQANSAAFKFSHASRSVTTLRVDSRESNNCEPSSPRSQRFLRTPTSPTFRNHSSGLLTPPELRVSGSSDDETDCEDDDDRSFFEERDQYGFKKSTQYSTKDEYERFISDYEPIVQRRREKWHALIKSYHGSLPAGSPTIKRYIRKGIPNEYRRQCWLHYSGAEARMRANPGEYDSLIRRIRQPDFNNEYVEIIERDLHRTFPDNIKFKAKISARGSIHTQDIATLQSLRRVLVAFSLWSSSVGYCQSLSYVAGLLLLFMNEEESFWTLVCLVEDIIPSEMYSATMEGAIINQEVFMLLLRDKFPAIYDRLDKQTTSGMPPVTLTVSHWFSTIFVGVMPVENVLRIWDCLFYEGYKIAFRITLTLFKMNESDIMSTQDPLILFQKIQDMPKNVIDCHSLLESCFKLTSLSRKEIDHHSRKYQKSKCRNGARSVSL
ncbi:TBC-domain-containing protein [Basidiobolus meristosporus CBS 931.73]|uniref:TBC-domain-containing protein n=1 Tax=Basidiobolus meristosporus CBS 931.73 TaxID=1314790 RepID=A0A1Y1YUI8_9FUNG|nr:TBC-domain-containing protein [Basidiobolus meristosporus CBS 931.73]|eukprot:ORY01702.1 TBC-domain-containing protein [Basidiobolus meristosporus CBS 931.73]